MATLTSTQVAGTTNVRLELDWSDNADVEYVKVVRLKSGESYDTSLHTGGTPIRLPTWGRTFSNSLGTWTYLSNFRGIWHDTEAPLDQTLTWVAVAQTLPAITRDAFNRVVGAGGWGSPDVGAAYTLSGTAADFSVDGFVGRIQPSATLSNRFAITSAASTSRTLTVDVAWLTLPASGTLRAGPAIRYTDANNHYIAEIDVASDGSTLFRILKRVGGTATTLAETTLDFKYVAALYLRIKVMIEGQTVSAKVWKTTVNEPADWMLTATDPSITPVAAFAMYARNASAATTHVATFENLRVTANTRTTVTVASTPGISLATSGLLWLKDPLRPGLNRSIDLCPTPTSGCSGPTGIFFHSMSGLEFAADHMVASMANRVRPGATSRARKAPTGELRLVTRTLADRDALHALLANGTPLLLQAPAVYGIPDMYLEIGDVSEDRIHVDHRVPFRLFTIPWAWVDAPAGPAQGVAETRWDDLCTNYATWALLIAAGWTWTDILQGDAA